MVHGPCSRSLFDDSAKSQALCDFNTRDFDFHFIVVPYLSQRTSRTSTCHVFKMRRLD